MTRFTVRNEPGRFMYDGASRRPLGLGLKRRWPTKFSRTTQGGRER